MAEEDCAVPPVASDETERPTKSTGSSSSAVQCCTVTQRDGVVIFSCKFPGCGREYASRDAVRKHCRLRHLDWLRSLDKGVAVEHQLVRPDKKRKGAAQQEANATRSSDEEDEDGVGGSGGKKKKKLGPGGRPYWASDALDESDQALRGALSLPEDANLNDFEVSTDDLFQAVQEGLGVDGGDAELLLTGIENADLKTSQGGAAGTAQVGESAEEGDAGEGPPAASRAMPPPPPAAPAGSTAPAASAASTAPAAPPAATAAPAPEKWPPLPPQLPPGARLPGSNARHTFLPPLWQPCD